MDKTVIKNSILEAILKTENLILECKEITKPIAPDCAVDHSLRMEKLNENELTLKILRQAEQRLIHLNLVLKQINFDSFGICLKCQSPIPIKRILIRPESLYCVDCSQ